MRKSRLLVAVLAAMAFAAMMALVACSQPAQSSSSSSDDLSLEPEEVYTMSTEPFYVLIVGNDTRLGTVDIDREMYADGNARSDTMMLARVDPKSYLITLVSIPRDTEDWAFDRVAKINDRYTQGGIEESVNAVEQLTGVRAKYYMDTNFVKFQDLINDLGGLEMYVPVDQDMKDIVSGQRISFPAGDRTLNGAEALVFARERKKYNPDGEVYRQDNDRLIVQTIIQKVLSDPATAVDVATKLYGDVESNWPMGELKLYVEDFMKNADKVHFIDGTGPYDGGDDPESELWLVWRNEDLWHEVMDVVNQGGDPNEVVPGLTLYE